MLLSTVGHEFEEGFCKHCREPEPRTPADMRLLYLEGLAHYFGKYIDEMVAGKLSTNQSQLDGNLMMAMNRYEALKRMGPASTRCPVRDADRLMVIAAQPSTDCRLPGSQTPDSDSKLGGGGEN